MKWLILLIIIFYHITAWSQDYHPVEHITTRDGMSHSHANHITKDQDGFMWISTEEGLNRYDGQEWKVYRHQKDDSTSISNNYIIYTIVDTSGNLYVYMFNEKRKKVWDYYDKKTNTFRRSSEEEVQSFLEKNNIWFYKQTNSNQELAWIKPKEPLYILKDLKTSETKKFAFSNFGGYSLPIDKNGLFWYPSINAKNDSLFTSFQLPKEIPLTDWQSLKVDNVSNIWLITKYNKIYLFDIKSKIISEVEKGTINNIRPKQIPFQDEEGTLWIPHRFGIAKIRKRYKYFENYLSDPKGWSKSKSKGIEAYSIVESAEDTIYALYGYGGVGVIPPDSGKAEKRFRYLNIDNKHKLLATDVMMVTTKDSSLWISVGTKHRSLNHFDLEKRTIKNFRIPDSLRGGYREGLTRDKLLYMVEGKDDKFWFTQSNGQLFSFDRTTSTFTSEDSTTRFFRSVMSVDDEGLWICNDDNLYFWDYKKGVTQQYQMPDIGSFKYKVAIYKVTPYKDKVWIATRNGLLEFDEQSKKFNHYTTKDGLSHNLIYTIIPHKDNLWMGTQDGLSRFNITNKNFKNYYQSDGLTDNEFNRHSALKSRNGKLYFGGLNGINAFYPDVLDSLSNLNDSPLIWSHFSKLGAKTDSLITHEYHELDTSKLLKFRYGDKSFSFQFALLSYANPSKNTYYYMLEGYEKEWSFNQNTSFLNYASLPPGKYTLRVKAKDALGNNSRNEIAIPIIVYGPWWELWWVRSLFSLLAVLGIVWYFNRRTTILEHQKQVLEKTVEKRTAELKKQKERAEQSEKYKEQFLANMSHEIRTPMHAISGMLNILQRSKHDVSQDVFLNAMRISSDNLVVILNDVLDISKIEAGKLDLESIPMSPTTVIENVVQILQYKAEEKGLLLNYYIEKEVPSLVMGDPTRLNQILLNLVGNAIKFTENGRVDITLSKKDDYLQYSIKDTGIGIPNDSLGKIFMAFEQAKGSTTRNYGGTGLGLNISKQLTELQGGSIRVESKEGKGSIFHVSLPIVATDIHAVGQDVITEEQIQTMAAALKGLRILLAEDNDFNQMIAMDDLTFYIEDVKIDIVENGKLAMEAFQANTYDLVLMDVQMPEMNGFETTKGIRHYEKATNQEPIPIIAMTASLLKTEIDKCYAMGMNNYIPKPYKLEELIRRIYEEVS